MIIGDIYFEGYYPPEQMRPGEYEDIYFYVENIGDESGYIWVDHYRNGILIKDSIEALLPGNRVRLFTPGYVTQGEGSVEYEIRVGHFTNYPSGKTQDGLLYFVVVEEIFTCSEYTNQSECETNNCYWYDDGTGVFCHPTVICDSITNQTDCEDPRNGCYWCNGHCQAQPCDIECGDYINQSDCEANNCYWYNESCHSSPPPPPIPPIPWTTIAIVGGATITVGVIVAVLLKKKK